MIAFPESGIGCNSVRAKLLAEKVMRRHLLLIARALLKAHSGRTAL